MGIMTSGIKNLNKVTNSAFMEKHIYKEARENPARFAGQMALLSALSKDAVNCYYYTTQSLNNEKIPEDKRGFVASLDLMNGMLNLATQFTIGKWIDKNQGKWFDSLVGSKLKADDSLEIGSKVHDLIQKNNEYGKEIKDLSPKQVGEFFIKTKVLGKGGGTHAGWLSIGFSALTMLVATQIVCKRMFTPFIATPLAGWFNNKFIKKDKQAPKNNNSDFKVPDSSIVKYENKPDRATFNSIKA